MDTNLYAKDFNIGKRFRDTNFALWEVSEIEGRKVFKNINGSNEVESLSSIYARDAEGLNIIDKIISVNGEEISVSIESSIDNIFGLRNLSLSEEAGLCFGSVMGDKYALDFYQEGILRISDKDANIYATGHLPSKFISLVIAGEDVEKHGYQILTKNMFYVGLMEKTKEGKWESTNITKPYEVLPLSHDAAFKLLEDDFIELLSKHLNAKAS